MEQKKWARLLRRVAPASWILFAAWAAALAGCSDVSRIVVVNGSASAMSVLDLALPPRLTDGFGGIELGPSANRVVVRGPEAFVVSSGTFGSAQDASIRVIDLESASVVRTIPLPDGDSPWAMAFVDDHKAYVTNLYADSITIVDPQLDGAAAILGRIDLHEGSAPEGIIVHEGRAYTANTGLSLETFLYGPGTLSVIDTSSDTVVDADGDPSNGADTPVSLAGVNAQDLEVDPGGALWVACTGDWAATAGTVDIVDTATLSLEDSLAVGGAPGAVGIGAGVVLLGDGAGARLFAADLQSRTVIHDASNPVVLSTTPWSFVPEIRFDRSGQVAYALGYMDDAIFEMIVPNGRVKLRNQYRLEAGSGPAGLALVYEQDPDMD
ncbi:MAG: hypothetical protein AB1640_18735 [bacterium]